MSMGSFPEQLGYRLAAIVFDRDDDPDLALGAFVAAQRLKGFRIAGLLQRRAEGCACHDVDLLNLWTGESLAVMQDLGLGSTGCRIDPAAIAVAAQQLRGAFTLRPDLLVANRFAKLEAEGGGLIDEIGAAVAEDLPLIVCVPVRFLDAWNGFAAGLDAQLAPRQEAIEAWWAGVAPARASAA